MAATNTADRRQALQAFDDTKVGVKGLVDAGVITVPPIFHHSPDFLPTSSSVTIPVIDLSAHRSDVLAQVKAAAETVGFFQVVNHGVPAGLLAETLESVHRFQESPPEAKTPYYTRDLAKKLRFNSNFDLFQSPAANWRDTLFCQAFPGPPWQDELPPAVRGVLPEYSAAVRRLAVAVLELMSEALGLAPDRLVEMGCVDGVSVVGNYYPPCPEPRLTLGTSRHSDPAFLTVLLQDYDIPGLQVLVDDNCGEEGKRRRVWADMPPVPGALVINVGDLLQLVSNGRLRSVEQRVVANDSRDGRARVSVAAFCNVDLRVTTARVYGLVEELVSSSAPPLYRNVTVPEFLSHYVMAVSWHMLEISLSWGNRALVAPETVARVYGLVEELVSSSAPPLYRNVTVPEFLSHYVMMVSRHMLEIGLSWGHRALVAPETVDAYEDAQLKHKHT